MTAILITVVTPTASADLSVPSTLPMSDLVDQLDPELASGRWTISDHNGVPIDANTTLEEAGVLDGQRLFLTPVVAGGPPKHQERTRESMPVSSRVVVPARTPLGARLTMAAGALVGVHHPPGTTGPWDRIKATWHWTDHLVRVRWLISRPLIRRPVIVGVTGHRSDDVAERLADTLASIRLDRVVLVDAGIGRDLTRRLPLVGQEPEAIGSALQRGDMSGVELEKLFGRTRLGTFTVSWPDSSLRLLDSLTTFAGIVIVDCGGFDSADADVLERCDQVVASTIGGVPELDPQTIAAVWGDVDPPRDVFAARSIDDTEDAMTELALVAVSGWSALHAATAVPTMR